MHWITFSIALAIAVAAIVYITRPLLKPALIGQISEDGRLAILLQRKDNILHAIKELEFDHLTGKLSEVDYQPLNQRLRRQAIELMQQIETVMPEGGALDAMLEAEIARKRKTQDRVAPPATHPMQPTGAIHTDSPQAKFCTQCGKAIGENHRFCAHCGTPV